MVTFPKSYDLLLQQVKEPHRLAHLVRELVQNTESVYTIRRKKTDAVSMKLMSKALFDTKVDNLYPIDSLPVLQNPQEIDVASAAIRMDEMYRLVTGDAYNIYDYYPQFLEKSGSALKTSRDATQPLLLAENKIADGGEVFADYPIANDDSVSARKPSAALTVSLPITGRLIGQVALFDGGPLVANGTAVELVYATNRYKVLTLLAGSDEAVLAPVALIDYLEANSI
jgi:hypothetical protein